MKQRGLTLIELLAGLVLLGLVAALAVPAFGALIDAQRRHDTARHLVSSLRQARVEAIVRSQPVIMQAHSGGWSQGWSVYVDSNQNRFSDDDEPVLVHHAGHRHVRVVGNTRVAEHIGFESTGRLVSNANGTLAVCQKDSAASHYQIAIAVTGRVTLRTDGFTTEPCA